MADDLTNVTGRWLKRLSQSISGEPRDREELIETLNEAGKRGLIDQDALSMIERVLEVSDIQVRDIMIPRSQMVVIQRDDAPEAILPAVVESGHSRYPVIGADRDEVVGILLAKDLLKLYSDPPADGFDIKEFLRPAVVVPESKRLNVLLKEFRLSRNHMAIVVDEYGGVSGLVTIEDVIEQIIGEIDDEYDVEDDQPIRRDSARHFTVRGMLRIEEFNDYFNTRFSDEDFDTIGGLVTHELGHVPRRGDTVAVLGIEFKVLRADRRRIDMLRVTTPHDVHSTDGKATDRS